MKDFLWNALSIIALIVVVGGIGLTIEWNRRRSLNRWVQEQGGTFEAGGLLDGVAVAEAAAFGPPSEKATYHNVSRFTRPEASYVLGQYQSSYKDTKSEVHSFSYVVCFITLPAGDWPEVVVTVPMSSIAAGMGSLLGRPDPPPPLALAETSPAFAEKFQATAWEKGADPKPAVLARFLSKAVQDELASAADLVSAVHVRGNVVRLQAISRQVTYPHQEVFALATRLGGLWNGK